ncbi:MAG: hypothetical protein DBX91_04805 [Subdoligranulum variabile]|nr:MAG: hypothetical protein DBX91_04805 [Subdoligranulum variabile]
MLRKTMFQKAQAAALAAAMMFTVCAPGGTAFAETAPDPGTTATPESAATPETAPTPTPEPTEAPQSAAAPALLAADDVQTYAGLPSGDPNDGKGSNHLINGVSPNGTTIDVFDYWQTTQEGPDTNANDIDAGINAGHALLFGSDIKHGAWNEWTGDETTHSGIVQNKLGDDGYPVLALTDEQLQSAGLGGRTANESLAYLFNPSKDVNGKASYPDAQGLLQVDSEGYYYYDSTKNYAVLYPADLNDKDSKNSFALYGIPGGYSLEKKDPPKAPVPGQFFPFNAVTEVDEQDGIINPYSSGDASFNHFFGVHMSTRFIQQNGGYVDQDKRTPVTYEFSGDDDVWIFIDGKLVANLGGIHDAASVNINFVTGNITINESLAGNLGEIFYDRNGSLTNNTYHTLDFFYLERGNNDSNMKLRYNLVTIPESTLHKVDQYGEDVPGATFELYAAVDYATNPNTTPIATGTTDSEGKFVFVKDNGAGETLPITLNELYETYGAKKDEDGNNLILKEVTTPDGYRSASEPIGLYFSKSTNPSNTDEVFLLSRDPWSTGAYAMPQVTATTGNSIYLMADATNTPPEHEIKLVGEGSVSDPTMFAVVFQKQTNDDGVDTWLPMCGDPVEGWYVQPDNKWPSILAAAQANPYEFQLSSSGAYQVEIDNLPGDINTYYHICGDVAKAKYTVVYYYTEANSLNEAKDTNTWRIDADGTESTYPLDRVFSMNLEVANVYNRLFVQKLDDENQPVEGAKFTLYKQTGSARDVDAAAASDVPDGFEIFDTVETGPDGYGVFPKESANEKKNLEPGYYLLRETSAPSGYKVNDSLIPVFVDGTGVYADAGNANDGITVSRGVGNLVGSMTQFAADDTVDTTLFNIRAALAQNVTFDNGTINWKDANWESGDVLHLEYVGDEDNDKGVDYAPKDETAPRTLSTDVGWSKLLVQQCPNSDHQGNTYPTANRTDLTKRDLTSLFSGTVTVQVTNQRVGSLTVTKTVTGNQGETNREWNFTVTLTDAQGNPATDVNGEYGEMKFENGVATFTLTDGDSKTAKDLPADLHYEVTEAEANHDGYVTTVGSNQSGTISMGQTATVAFTNSRNGEVGSLIVSKTVEGAQGDKNKDWNFTVTLTDADGSPATEVNSDYGEMTFVNGVAEFTLKDGQSIIATNLPAGLTYTVTETEANQGNYTTTAPGDKGTIKANDTVEVNFTNTWNAPNPTPSPAPEEPNDSNDSGSSNSPAPSSQPTAPAQDPGTDAADTSAATAASAVPQTSDNSPIELWTLLCVVSLGGLLTVFALKRIRRGDHSQH